MNNTENTENTENTKGRHKCDDKKSNYTIFYKLEDSVVGGIVEDISGGKMVLDDIAVKYGIRSTTSLMSVLKRYKGEDFVNNLMAERKNRKSKGNRGKGYKVTKEIKKEVIRLYSELVSVDEITKRVCLSELTCRKILISDMGGQKYQNSKSRKSGKGKKAIDIDKVISLYRGLMSPSKISIYLGLNGRHNEIRVILEGNLSSEEFHKIDEEIKLERRAKMNKWIGSCVCGRF